jgi:hypothetical protein
LATSVTKYPTNAVNEGTTPLYLTWLTPEKVTASDLTYASATTSANGVFATEYLITSGYGFSIPATATINGISATVARYSVNGASTACYVTDTFVKLVKPNLVKSVADKADRITHYPTTLTPITYGSASDLWFEAWTPSDINSTNFGLAFTCGVANTPPYTTSVYIDYITITVTYTEVASLLKVNVGGQLKAYSDGWVKIDNTLRRISSITTKVGGVLKKG